MGYYTRFELRVNGKTDYHHREAIGKSTAYGDESIWNEERKWYEHEEDMVAYSKLYPNDVFCLYGNGERYGDVWFKFFKNGKFYKHEIEFPDFNPELLK